MAHLTQQKFKNQLIRAVANRFVNMIPFTIPGGYEITTVDDFRRIVSEGQTTTVSGDLVTEGQQLVLYQQDYQPTNTDFDSSSKRLSF